MVAKVPTETMPIMEGVIEVVLEVAVGLFKVTHPWHALRTIVLIGSGPVVLLVH